MFSSDSRTPSRKENGAFHPPFILGIDTGGTFTDLVAIDKSGRVSRWKVPSTPGDPSRAIIHGLRELLGHFRPEELEIVHGTTVGTNAFLERKGARTCLITTRGFEDVMLIGRQNRPSLYNFMVQRPRQVIDPRDIKGIAERTLFDGKILLEPEEKELEAVAGHCRERGIQSVAVCLLHSYANPENENRITSFFRKLGLPTCPSSEILPEFREYERTSTTVLNAYLGPVIGDYISRLEDSLPGSAIFVQQSGGGCRPARDIGRFAVTTLLSGPAGGVAASLELGRALGLDNIITFDMGGTSTDVSLCPGDFTYTREYSIQGFPVSLPMIDIHTVGAGGGSIAWIDRGGLMKVGPESAGADPGPVCYGGGERLTVTDANLFLGRLRPGDFLGGRMRLCKKRVISLMEELGEQLGMSPEETALGIIRIVNVNMIQAIRTVSLERGFDPREFSLVSFGGAAGLHCMELARELGIEKVLIPGMAGVFSARGMAGSDLVFEGSAALFLVNDRDIEPALQRAFQDLNEKLAASLPKMHGEDKAPVVERFLDVRYRGQSFEITIPYDARWEDEFHLRHKRLYGYHLPGSLLEITAVRCRLRMKRVRSAETLTEKTASQPTPEVRSCKVEETEILFEHGIKKVPVIYRKWLNPKEKLTGPLLVIDDYTTLLVPGGWTINDLSGHILAQRE